MARKSSRPTQGASSGPGSGPRRGPGGRRGERIRPRKYTRINSETIDYKDYVALNGETGARDAGKLRLEGKDYVVKDGDVLHFRFAN